MKINRAMELQNVLCACFAQALLSRSHNKFSRAPKRRRIIAGSGKPYREIKSRNQFWGRAGGAPGSVGGPAGAESPGAGWAGAWSAGAPGSAGGAAEGSVGGAVGAPGATPNMELSWRPPNETNVRDMLVTRKQKARTAVVRVKVLAAPRGEKSPPKPAPEPPPPPPIPSAPPSERWSNTTPIKAIATRR
jgi:hypothetical protein